MRTLIAMLVIAVATPAWGQTTFATPEAATQALAKALKAADAKALLAIFGPKSKPILSSGDRAEDKRARERFLAAYEEAAKLDKADATRVVLRVGKDDWPFPIPLVKTSDGWRFDVEAGREEIINRRIGRNELAAMQVVGAYVDAQREYYLRNPQNDKLLHYSQKLRSAEGKRDGLYWPVKAGEKQSPLGPLLAGSVPQAAAKPAPYHGYYYRILKAQGPDAPGGAYGYLAQGRMIGGFALVAWPAAYANSGVMTFIVNHDGVIYEKDLGRDTAALAGKITRFNPDKTWLKAQ